MDRSPICTSLVAQTNPARLAHCDPGAGVGYRLAFYGDDGSWEQVETGFPVMTQDEARCLIASANAAVLAITNQSTTEGAV